MRKHSFTRALIIATTAVFLPGPPGATPPTDEQDQLLQGLRNKIVELRSGGNFAAAVTLAEEVASTLQSEPTARLDQMVDAEWLLRTTRMLAALPDSSQAKMVLVEAWKREYRGLLDQRAYERAEGIIARVIVAQKDILGTVHPETAGTLVELARVHMQQLLYASADSLVYEGLSIQKSTLGEIHVDVASTLSSRAQLFAGMKRLSAADSLSRQALVIRIKVLGADDPEVARSLQDYAAVRIRLRDPVAAEVFLRRAQDILRDRYGESSPAVVRQMQDLADLLAAHCDHAAAARLHEKTLEIQLQKYGANHLHVALLRKDLAKSLAALGDYKTSEVMYREALDVLYKRLDPNHEIVAQVLNDLGMVLLRMGNLGEAAGQFDRAVAICRHVHGPGGVAEAAVLISYGTLFQETRDYAKAREYFAQATEIYRERMGETSPLFAGALFQMARALTGQHEYGQARLLLIEACRILENNRRRLRNCRCSMDPPYARVTPYRLLAFNELQMNNASAAFDALERDYADSLVTRFDTRWFRRLNAAEARQERYVQETVVRLEQLVANRFVHANAPRTDTDRESMRAQLARAQQSWDILQARLRARYPADEGHAFGLHDIQSSLQAGAGLIGWMDVAETRYVYLVPPYGDVVWQELDPPADDSLYTRFKSMLVDPRADDAELGRLAAEVYRLRLGPLEPYLQRMTTLYVVPSGPMVGIPVEILPVDGRPIGSGRTVCYTPSASFFRWLRARPRSTVPASMLAIGDPPFNDEQARDMYLGDHGPDADAGLSDPEREELFAAVLEGRPAAAERLPRLAGTRREIGSFANMFVPNTVLLGLDASEARIEPMTRTVSDFGFVHLATYAITDDVRGERSSLVLSQSDGADVLDSIVRGRRLVDGRLTVEEILRDWRLEAEVVTLSACQNHGTRLGGGFGFAYVFLRAGARSVVFNRWYVADTPTRILMKRFYHNLAERRLDKTRALDDAKAWLRDFTTESGEHPYTHPAYWASFALVGDPYWATY